MSDAKEFGIEPVQHAATAEVDETITYLQKEKEDDFEVFKQTKDGVQFRIVGWPMASMIFIKTLFATGVLSIPTAMYGLGAVGGALSVVGWGAVNTYFAIVQGNFRNRHAHCHSIADMALVVGGPFLKELIGILFLLAYIICTGSAIIGLSVGLNALSDHGACTVWWVFLSTVFIIAGASIRKFEKIGWLTWAGFVSIYVAVFIVVVGVTARERPSATPQTGDFDLGYHAAAYPGFIVGITATCTIFVSSAATSAFLPVISEMKNPKDYNKAVYVCMSIVQSSYLTFSLVVYKWCGKWVANPSLGSAGPTVKKISYGIGLIGLAVSGCLYLHIGAKYIFVRILRNSTHLQRNSLTHWITWLSCTIGLGAISFIFAEAVPIFSYLIALMGALCFAPIAIILPAWLWLYDHSGWSKGAIGKKMVYLAHVLMAGIGIFVCIGGMYGIIMQIKMAYADGTIGGAFDCADNSGLHG